MEATEYPQEIIKAGKKRGAKPGVPRNKKVPLLSSKIGKYFVAVKSGKTKKAAAIIAGYHPTNTTAIEATKQFKALSYKEELLAQITLKELAMEQLKVIKQDDNYAAKNTAIAQAMEKIEPELVKEDDDDRMIVILRQE